MAKGLPVIIGCHPSLLSDCKPEFIIEIENNSNPVNVGAVITEYDRLLKKYKPNELRHEIRNFAEEFVSIDKVMNPIIEYLKENN